MVRQNRAAVSIGSVATEHPPPREMGAGWFGSLLVQNLKYSSKATSALHCRELDREGVKPFTSVVH